MKNVCRWKGLLYIYGHLVNALSWALLMSFPRPSRSLGPSRPSRSVRPPRLLKSSTFKVFKTWRSSRTLVLHGPWGPGYAGGPTDVIGPSRPSSSLRSSRTQLSTTWGPGLCCAGVSVPESLWSYATSVSHQSRWLLPFLLIVFSCPSSSIPTWVIHSFINSPFIIQSHWSIDLVR